jgi:RHS repeat-associated protein
MSNVASTTDALGHTTSYGYDALYRKVSLTDAAGQQTRLTYDATGNLTSLTDPSGNATRYSYDALNRETSDTNALGFSRFYRYDAVGNLSSTTDRDGRTRQFSYDGLNRQTQETWLDASGTSIHTSTATYDAVGQLIAISDPDSAYGYTYDLAGQLTSLSNTGTPRIPTVVMNYGYDAVSNLTSVTDQINGQTKATTAYRYDNLNRATQLTQSGNGVNDKRVDMTYDKASQLTQLSRYGNLSGTQLVAQSNYVYDRNGRLTDLTHQNTSTTYAAYQWAYDSHNRVTQFTSTDGTNVYTYKSRDELTGTDSNYQTDEAYSYDASGNRTNAGYQTGTNNRLLSDGTYSYTYDNEGNRTSRKNIATGEVTAYSWDYHNRLTGVTTKDINGTLIKAVGYTYDVYDRRIGKSVDADGAGVAAPQTEWYVYDGSNVSLVFDGQGNQTHRYLYGTGVDQILADETQTGVNWALVDNLGSVRDVVDNNGNLLNHITYNSFGQVSAQTNAAIDFRYGYTGRELDKETGLDYYRARYYDTTTGGFLSEDPMGFAAGDVNLYRYTANNPINFKDPSGLASRILTQLFSQSHISSRNKTKKPTIYEFNTVFPKYSQAYNAARFWFHAIILTESKTIPSRGKTSRVPWVAPNLLRDDLSTDLPTGINYRGRVSLRPGSTSDPIQPTLNFQEDNRGEWHKTPLYTNATELKFTYRDHNDNPCDEYEQATAKEKDRARRKAEDAPIPVPIPAPTRTPFPVPIPAPIPNSGQILGPAVEFIGSVFTFFRGIVGLDPKF